MSLEVCAPGIDRSLMHVAVGIDLANPYTYVTVSPHASFKHPGAEGQFERESFDLRMALVY